jgi:hypothetical protein
VQANWSQPLEERCPALVGISYLGKRMKWLDGSHVRRDDHSLMATEILQAVKQRQAH